MTTPDPWQHIHDAIDSITGHPAALDQAARYLWFIRAIGGKPPEAVYAERGQVVAMWKAGKRYVMRWGNYEENP